MKLRCATLTLLVALAAGCGDLQDSRCDPPEPHQCLQIICCDPICNTAGERSSCTNVGYQCQIPNAQCTCGSDGFWHCTDASAPKDLSVHVVTDMARPPGD